MSSKDYGQGPLVPVFALKIKDISEIVDGFATILPEEDQKIADPITVSAEYIEKYNPQVGGLYIMCEGGYGLYSS